MPGAVARTSTFALNNATIGHALALPDKGWKQACKANVHLKNGLNVAQGKVTYEAVARDLGHVYVAADSLLG
jgi:alanine dehydrogenase